MDFSIGSYHTSLIHPLYSALHGKLALLASYPSHPTILPSYWYYTYVTLLCFHNHFSYLAIHLYSYCSCLLYRLRSSPFNCFIQSNFITWDLSRQSLTYHTVKTRFGTRKVCTPRWRNLMFTSLRRKLNF